MNLLIHAYRSGRPWLLKRSVVRNGINGLLFDAAPDFERQLHRLLTEPNLRPALSRPDPQTFSAEAEGERLATLLEELCPRLALVSNS